MKLKLLFTYIIIQLFVSNTKGRDTLFFEVRNDTVIFYLDNVGDITTKKRAEFYRETVMGDSLGFYNNISDFYLNNHIAFKYLYDSKCDKQLVTSYYKNGQIKYTGYSNNFLRDSLWTFYYDNGNLKKKIIYTEDKPFVKEFYKKNGKSVFTNATGKYKDKINAIYKNPTEHSISGKIRNGKMEGGWNWSEKTCQGKEYFKNGEFVKTETYGINDGFKDPRIITKLCGYDKHEFVEIFKFIAIPNENDRENKEVRLSGIPVNFSNNEDIRFSTDDFDSSIKYKGESNLSKTFANDLALVLKSIDSNSDFWTFVQFSVLESGAIENVKVHSNNEMIVKPFEDFIKKINTFEPRIRGNQNIRCDIYLSIIFAGNKIYFPEYNYNNLPIYLYEYQ
jgi:antitoxin component YwqK of YwqJK toxin-antitoxin module